MKPVRIELKPEDVAYLGHFFSLYQQKPLFNPKTDKDDARGWICFGVSWPDLSDPANPRLKRSAQFYYREDSQLDKRFIKDFIWKLGRG